MTENIEGHDPPCKHCGITMVEGHAHEEHQGLCCDCYDLSWGMPLEDVNKERATKDLPPITKPWPVRS